MQSSLDLLPTKDEIEQLLRERHMVDKKLEAKTREQNDLTEKCIRHIRVLRKKGMTEDFYSPEKHGISATPTKAMSGSYTPNYVPSNYMATIQQNTLQVHLCRVGHGHLFDMHSIPHQNWEVHQP